MIDEFAKSIPMSTYLVAYIISDLSYVKPNNHDDKEKIRIIVRKEATNQTDYALKIITYSLKYFENYFNERFPLPKIDIAVIPDLQSGGMENFGLITFK